MRVSALKGKHAMSSETNTGQRPQAVTVTLNPAIDRTVTIPNFAAGKVNRVEQMQQNPGGKGVNVASILADYGHAIAVTGFLGRENSASFEELFAQKHIDDHFIRIAGQTRVGIKISDPVQQQTTDINFPGQAPTQADLDALFGQLARLDATWFVLAGSIPPGVEPAIYRDIVTTLKAQGHNVALDSSGEALRLALEAAPQIIKPNVHELEEILGTSLTTPDAIVHAVKPFLERGTRLVAVSMGEQGACFITEEGLVAARPPRVDVKSTVGAGDAMVAGIIAGQLRGLSLADCARLATAFSLDAITHIGSGLSSVAAVEGLMKQVRVE
jgi:1-phosphofructokinase